MSNTTISLNLAILSISKLAYNKNVFKIPIKELDLEIISFVEKPFFIL